MNTAIDACERIERSGYSEANRDVTIQINEHTVSLHDLLVSASTYPEHMRYCIIRERHDLNANLPYVPETARILQNMAAVAAELVDTADRTPANQKLRDMITWYHDHLPTSVEKALNASK